MRLFPLLIVGTAAFALAACDASSDCGGPTSDWPHCNHGNGDSDDGSDAPPKTGGTPSSTNGGGKAPPGLKDAGTKTGDGPTTSPPDGPTTGGLGGFADAGAVAVTPSSDAGVHDAGIADGGVRDAALDAQVDASTSHCAFDADRSDAGSCFGMYCASNEVSLQSRSASSGACTSSADLALVCDGELSRVVSGCAQDDALFLGFGGTIRECARDTKSLDSASDGCIDCYVDELLCAARHCLTPCLASLSDECTTCPIDHCSSAFVACSGLPRPQ